VVIRPDGIRVVTVTDEYGRIVRRYREYPDSHRVVLFDNRPSWWRDDPDYYVVDVPPPRVTIPYERYVVEPSVASPAMIYGALTAPPVQELEQRYTLDQVLRNDELRDYMPRVDLDTITFEFGSAEVADDQIDRLEGIGVAIEEAVAEDPNEVFLIEGHTDAVGSDLDNLELSDRRAEAVAVLLTDYFEIPPENLVTQGYGEQYLKVNTQEAEQENRRVTVRRITPLLTSETQTNSDVGSGTAPAFVIAVRRPLYIRNTPNFVSLTGAFSVAERLRPSTSRVLAGSMMPSSHSLAEE